MSFKEVIDDARDAGIDNAKGAYESAKGLATNPLINPLGHFFTRFISRRYNHSNSGNAGNIGNSNNNSNNSNNSNEGYMSVSEKKYRENVTKYRNEGLSESEAANEAGIDRKFGRGSGIIRGVRYGGNMLGQGVGIAKSGAQYAGELTQKAIQEGGKGFHEGYNKTERYFQGED